MDVDSRKIEKKYFYESYASKYDETLNFYDLERRREIIFSEFASAGEFIDRLVLDAGSGTGWLSKTAAQLGARVISMDLGIQLASASQRRAGGLAVVGDMTNLPFRSGSIEMIVCAEVIEHMADQAEAVSEASRVLRPRGVLLLTTPNRIWHFAIVVANLLKLRPYEGIENWIGRGRLIRLLGDNEMRVTYWTGFNLFPFVTHLFRHIPEGISRTLRAVERMTPLRLRGMGLNIAVRAVKEG